MAFASIVSSSGGSKGNSTAPSFTMPAPINSGNLILVFAGTDNAATFTVPSGYTAISQQDATEFQVAVFGKIADGTEDSTTVDGTLSATESSCYIALAIQDWSGSLSDVDVGTIAQSQTAESVDPSGVTATWGADDNLFIACAIADFWDETATGFPTGFTGDQLTQQHVNQFGGTQAISLASKDSTNATENPDTFTYSATPGNWAAFTAVIRPGASGPSVTAADDITSEGDTATFTLSGNTLAPTSATINGEDVGTLTSQGSGVYSYTAPLIADDATADLVVSVDSTTASAVISYANSYPYTFTHGTPAANSINAGNQYASVQDVELKIVSDIDAGVATEDWSTHDFMADVDGQITAVADGETSVTVGYFVTETGQTGTFSRTITVGDGGVVVDPPVASSVSMAKRLINDIGMGL